MCACLGHGGTFLSDSQMYNEFLVCRFSNYKIPDPFLLINLKISLALEIQIPGDILFMFCNLFQENFFFLYQIKNYILNILLKITHGPLGSTTSPETPTVFSRSQDSGISISDSTVTEKDRGIVSCSPWRSEAVCPAASAQSVFHMGALGLRSLRVRGVRES